LQQILIYNGIIGLEKGTLREEKKASRQHSIIQPSQSLQGSSESHTVVRVCS
jgi:hypothetical protein